MERFNQTEVAGTSSESSYASQHEGGEQLQSSFRNIADFHSFF